MFIKLTRIDGRPIWINGVFTVTIEPRKGGGSLVVPMGDGMDYEVREQPEAVLDLLQGVPEQKVIAVPVPTGLTHTPEDVSPDTPDPESRNRPPEARNPAPEVRNPAPEAPEVAPETAAEAESPKRRTRKTATAKTAGAKKTTARKTTKKATAKESAEGATEESAEAPADISAGEPPPAAPASPAAIAPADVSADMPPVPAANLAPAAPKISVPEDDVARAAASAKKSGCRSERRLFNFLKCANQRMDESAVKDLIERMKARGFLSVDIVGHVTFA